MLRDLGYKKEGGRYGFGSLADSGNAGKWLRQHDDDSGRRGGAGAGVRDRDCCATEAEGLQRGLVLVSHPK